MKGSDSTKHNHRMHRQRRHKPGVQALFLVIGLVTILAAVLFAGQLLDRDYDKPDERTTITSGQSTRMQIGDVSYRKRRNLTSILVLGVDRASDDTTTRFRNGGQADFLRVIVIDDSQKKVYQLPIDRDTMATITTMGLFGNKAGTRLAQICLQHAYGQTQEQRSEMTKHVVQDLLEGQQIDHYISVSIDGVPAVNDWVGGVTVQIDEDLTEKDPEWTAGAVITLHGNAAATYVSSRRGVTDGMNTSRMSRQQNYIKALSDALLTRFRSGKSSVGELFDLTKPYLTTDLSRARLINIIWAAKDYDTVSLSITGSRRIGANRYMEFTADVESIEQALLTMFYEPVTD